MHGRKFSKVFCNQKPFQEKHKESSHMLIGHCKLYTTVLIVYLFFKHLLLHCCCCCCCCCRQQIIICHNTNCLHYPPPLLGINCTHYDRGGQTFLIAGQIWKLFLIAGRTIQNYRHESNNFCEAEKKKVFLMLNEMKNVQFLTNFVLIDRLMLLSQITKRGPRAAKISWRAALWPRLLYHHDFITS